MKFENRCQEKFQKSWKYYWESVHYVLACPECLGVSGCVPDFLWIWYVFLSGRWKVSFGKIKLRRVGGDLGVWLNVWNTDIQHWLAWFHQGTASSCWTVLVYTVAGGQKWEIGKQFTVVMQAHGLRNAALDVLHAIWEYGVTGTTAWFDMELILFFHHAATRGIHHMKWFTRHGSAFPWLRGCTHAICT